MYTNIESNKNKSLALVLLSTRNVVTFCLEPPVSPPETCEAVWYLQASVWVWIWSLMMKHVTDKDAV